MLGGNTPQSEGGYAAVREGEGAPRGVRWSKECHLITDTLLEGVLPLR